MKAPTTCDVFHIGNFFIQHSRQTDYKIINGNLYIDGHADAERTTDVLEVFGDLIINGTLYINNIIVHGNLICDRIVCGQKIVVDGDVFVSSKIQVKSLICKSGDIFFDIKRFDEKP